MFTLIVMLVGSVYAESTTEVRQAELDRRALELYQQVMSPFCPGRALSDCPSSKAHDLKSEMRRELEAGTPPDQILSGVFAKYGDQYRAVPGFSGFALLAWVAPIVFLVTGLLVALRLASARRVRAYITDSSQGAQIAPKSEISDSEKLEIERELARLD